MYAEHEPDETPGFEVWVSAVVPRSDSALMPPNVLWVLAGRASNDEEARVIARGAAEWRRLDRPPFLRYDAWVRDARGWREITAPPPQQ